jgi:hypothetical protein
MNYFYNKKILVVEKIKSRILCSIIFLQNHAVYKIVWENMVEPDRPQVKMLRLRFGWWINKATNTSSEYVILIAFSRQKLLHKCA